MKAIKTEGFYVGMVMQKIIMSTFQEMCIKLVPTCANGNVSIPGLLMVICNYSWLNVNVTTPGLMLMLICWPNVNVTTDGLTLMLLLLACLLVQ